MDRPGPEGGFWTVPPPGSPAAPVPPTPPPAGGYGARSAVLGLLPEQVGWVPGIALPSTHLVYPPWYPTRYTHLARTR